MRSSSADEKRKARVLLVINGTDFGGTESILMQVAKCLDARGYDVAVLSLKLLGRIGCRLEAAGIPVGSLSMEQTAGSGNVVRGIRDLTRLFDESGAQIIHYLPRRM